MNTTLNTKHMNLTPHSPHPSPYFPLPQPCWKQLRGRGGSRRGDQDTAGGRGARAWGRAGAKTEAPTPRRLHTVQVPPSPRLRRRLRGGDTRGWWCLVCLVSGVLVVLLLLFCTVLYNVWCNDGI